MARMPGAVWAPIPENSTQPPREVRGCVVHTFVDAPGPTDLRGYFARADIKVESTFVLPLTGPIVQILDSEVRADTQGEGNLWYEGGTAYGHGSVECEDEGDPIGVPFTDSQIRWLVDMFVWYHEEHGVELRWMEDPRDNAFGWHSMWSWEDPRETEGWLMTGPWTKARGKTCPGSTRIKQLQDVVMPAAIAKAQGGSMTDEQFDTLVKALQLNAAGINRNSGQIEEMAGRLDQFIEKPFQISKAWQDLNRRTQTILGAVRTCISWLEAFGARFGVTREDAGQ